MSISTGKHLEKEINEVRCRVVESGISRARADFLKELLELNGYEVQIEQEPVKPIPPSKPASISQADITAEAVSEAEPETRAPSDEATAEMPEPEPTFVIGVTDIIFNPVIAVYNRILKTKDGKRVTADYWNQKTTTTEPNYWDRSKKDWL